MKASLKFFTKKRLLYAVALAVALWLGWSAYFHLTTFSVNILYTNDLHGHILPYEGKGGAAALASFLKKVKGHYLLLDAGDFFHGTPESNLSLGKNTVLLMNHLGYDAATIGNHEFGFGQNNLIALSKLAEFPFLTANIYDRKTKNRIKFALPYIIEDLGGAKFAIFGLTTDKTPQISIPKNVKNLEFRNPIEEAKNVLAELEKKKPDIVIALTHLGFGRENQPFIGDRSLAQNTDGIDIIIGGHCHRRIEERINGVYIVQTAGLGRSVGKLTIRLDRRTKRIRSLKNEIVELDIKKIGEDEGIKKIVSELTGEISKLLSEKIGFCEVDLIRKRNAESTIGNFLADTMRDFAKTDISFHNSGGIRTDIKKGDITLRDIYTLMPFDNTIVTMTLSGRQIKRILEQSFGGTSGFLQVAGIKAIYDSALKKTEVLFKNKPIEENRYYTVATNSFLAAGGDGFKMFTEGKNIKDTNAKFRDVIIERIKKTKNISAKIDGRIFIK